ncbi:MAG: oligosaccharide flippase family protein [Limisphaerales bacterium]
MNPIFKSTLILGSSSALSLFIGLLATKCLAVVLGPAGFGYLGLLQNLLMFAGMVAGLSVGTGLVRFGAEALAHEDGGRVEALRRGSWLLTWALGGTAFGLMFLLRRPISELMLDQDGNGLNVVLIGVALLFSLAGTIFASLLNARHRVTALARLNLLSRAVAAVAAVGFVLVWREEGIVAAVVGGAVAGWAVSWWLYAREARSSGTPVPRQRMGGAVRDLLRFGGSCTASLVVGAGVQLLVPVIVLKLMGKPSVGLYRAVGLVSTVYLGFLLTTMTQDYYPRISRVSQQPAILAGLVNEQHQLILLLAVPLIVFVLAAAPVLIPFIYSREWSPVVSVLEWQLIGDILKFSSWTMAFALLVRNRTGLYFFAESVAGVATLVSTLLGIRWFGLDGLGIAYVVQYAIYLVVVWLLVRREIHLRLTPLNRCLLGFGLASVSLIRLLGLCGFDRARTPVAWGLAILVSLISFRLIQKEYGVLTWMRWPTTFRPPN